MFGIAVISAKHVKFEAIITAHVPSKVAPSPFFFPGRFISLFIPNTTLLWLPESKTYFNPEKESLPDKECRVDTVIMALTWLSHFMEKSCILM